MQDRERIQVERLLTDLLREPQHLFPTHGGKLEASNRKGVYITFTIHRIGFFTSVAHLAARRV
jgi:hypothetical protein